MIICCSQSESINIKLKTLKKNPVLTKMMQNIKTSRDGGFIRRSVLCLNALQK